MTISRLAKRPVEIPQSVSAKIENKALVLSSKDVVKTLPIHSDLNVVIDGSSCSVLLKDGVNTCAQMGTFVAKLKNLVADFEKPKAVTINLLGVGFKAFKADGDFIVMSLGYSHLVAVHVPKSITATIRDANKIDISGFTEDVSSFVDDLKATRPWDPCRQKGVVVAGEFLRKKEGKKK